ncbi:MAG: YggS family pyridoxal phosphate-dependent enzyme [Candidatus Saelkia tenebricola]|nr:YggS family pyridoxal phosphate-dependent enzyme [Candidatus Saelkia tenebricola]
MLDYWAMLQENIKVLREKIEKAAFKSNRSLKDVKLLAVTKNVGVDFVREAVALGITEIGENRIQEARSKFSSLKDLDLKWHMVGHLQTNKVKYAVELFDYLHSLDSLKLAYKIEDCLFKHNKIMNVFIEINTSGEDSKFGIESVQVINMVNEIFKLPHLNLMGFMTVAPIVENIEDVRPYFRKLKILSERLGEKFNRKFHLSMGMSDDFEIAVEEGADLIRIGSAIFKEKL